MPKKPDYHFLYLDPTLSAEWLFVAARRYWDKFRPIVINDLELVELVPTKRSIAITILARRDLAPVITKEVSKRFARAYIDPLVYDVYTEMKLTLDGRADFNQRFGIPE